MLEKQLAPKCPPPELALFIARVYIYKFTDLLKYWSQANKTPINAPVEPDVTTRKYWTHIIAC